MISSAKFNNININMIKNLQELDYSIQPYKVNYLKYLKVNEWHYNKMDLIYDVNNGISQMMDRLSKKINEGINVATLDTFFFKELCKVENIYPSILGLDGFPKASCISINNQVCHSVPYRRNLQSGDLLKIDICGYNGYHSDMANTYMVGRVSGQHKALVDMTKKCMDYAIEKCAPNVDYQDIAKIVQKIAKDNGFVVIENYAGHGIGRELHMPPIVSNYVHNNFKDKKKVYMKEGDMFCIEPLLTINSGKTYIDRDNFTVLTYNNQYAAHFERTIMITDSGHQVLN